MINVPNLGRRSLRIKSGRSIFRSGSYSAARSNIESARSSSSRPRWSRPFLTTFGATRRLASRAASIGSVGLAQLTEAAEQGGRGVQPLFAREPTAVRVEGELRDLRL